MAGGFSRALIDLEEGRLWKAKERLEGLLAGDPASQETLTLLGKTCYRMGDLPAAGRYWFLTAQEGDVAAAAQAAMMRRHRGGAALLTALPIRAPLEAYPPIVRERLSTLAAEVQGEAPWLRYTPKMRRVTEEEAYHRGGPAIVGGLLTAVLVPWLVGLGTLGYGIWKLLTQA